jgi:hypothetical protein
MQQESQRLIGALRIKAPSSARTLGSTIHGARGNRSDIIRDRHTIVHSARFAYCDSYFLSAMESRPKPGRRVLRTPNKACNTGSSIQQAAPFCGCFGIQCI